MKTSEQYFDRLAQGIHQELLARYGKDFLSVEDVHDSLLLLTTSGGMEAAVRAINLKLADARLSADSALLETEDLTEESFREMYDAVEKQYVTILKVYKEDGVTYVGEFEVASS